MTDYRKLLEGKKLTVPEIIERTGLTMAEFARKCDIDPRHLYNVCNGTVKVSGRDVLKILIFTDLEPEDIEV